MARSLTDEAQAAIGYRFHQTHLLEEALTHKSHVNEVKPRSGGHNERLEFLGDAVLSLIVSEHLAAICPDSTEGELSKLKASLVSEASLAKAARILDIGALLRLGRGEELTRGRDKNSLLGNALEALIAAVYLDGGMEAARVFTLRALAQDLRQIQHVDAAAIGDYKTQLQEWCQKRYDVLPQYVTVRESGPDHRKVFEVQLTVRGDVVGVGVGRSKKEAEQMAAKQALTAMAET